MVDQLVFFWDIALLVSRIVVPVVCGSQRLPGTIVYAVMISLGEMVSYLPIPGGHIKLAERFVNPAWSFAMG